MTYLPQFVIDLVLLSSQHASFKFKCSRDSMSSIYSCTLVCPPTRCRTHILICKATRYVSDDRLIAPSTTMHWIVQWVYQLKVPVRRRIQSIRLGISTRKCDLPPTTTTTTMQFIDFIIFITKVKICALSLRVALQTLHLQRSPRSGASSLLVKVERALDIIINRGGGWIGNKEENKEIMFSLEFQTNHKMSHVQLLAIVIYDLFPFTAV